MPMDNPYNRAIKSKLLDIANRKIAHDNHVANNPMSAEPKSQQDFISVVHPELEGGSGNLAHTSYDLGLKTKPQAMVLPSSNIEKHEPRN